MLTVIILCAVAAIAAGAVAMFILEQLGDKFTQINLQELVIGSLLISIVIIPLITLAGFSIVRNSTVSYNEFYGGLEKQAYSQTTHCRRDGSCRHEYNCDPYTVQVAHTRTVGSGSSAHTETYYTTEIRYHDCPYADEEISYYVKDTLGETYTFASHWFPAGYPSEHRWRGHKTTDNVNVGVPKKWAAVKERIASGDPGGTTKRAKYDNFIQASQDDIYDKYSDAIDSYLAKHQLPKVASEVHDYYLADKAYFPTGHPVGTTVKRWETDVMRLNGKIGGEKHGDLHLVFVDANKINDADQYSAALDAYWQSSALGKNTLSKNGLVVVVGYSGPSVTWARAFTGMPVGNEAFAVSVREQLPHSLVADLIGNVDRLVFDHDTGYKRVEMSDYRYLFDSIQPSGWAKFWIAFVAFLLSMGIWVGMAILDIRIPFRILNKENNV